MKRLLFALPLLLAACGSSSETAAPTPANGPAVREKINGQTRAYNDCVMGAIKSIEMKDRLASTLADEAFKNCRSMRDTLLADVLEFRRIGHPSEPQDISKVSAEQSVLNLDADLRDRVLVVATQRRLGENGNNAAN